MTDDNTDTAEAAPKAEDAPATPDQTPHAPHAPPAAAEAELLALPPASRESESQSDLHPEPVAHAPEPEPQPEAMHPEPLTPQPLAAQTSGELEPESVTEPVSETDTPEVPPAGPELQSEPTPAKKSQKPKSKAAKAETEPDAEAESAADGEAAGEAGLDDAPVATDPGTELAAEGGPVPVAEPESRKKWYVVKVQSGREDSIKAAIERKIKIEGLEEYFGQIAIPVEQYTEVKKVKEKKNGEVTTKEKKVLKERKKFQGYLFAEVEFNDRILYVFRETSGVGDFVGATGPMKPPPPMSDREVVAMLTGVVDPELKKKGPTKQVVKLDYEKGDKVKIRDGAFTGMEGEVKSITEPKETGETPKVTVTVTIFGRPVEVELDYWHVDKV